MMIGWVQPGTRRGTFLQMIGSRKTTPPRMLRIVPLGDFHICFEAEFLHPGLVRCDGGALDADAVPLDRLGRVDRHLVVGGVAVLHPQVVVVQLDIEEGEDQLVLDPLPDDPGHLVPVDVDDRVGDFDLCHEGQALRAKLRFGGPNSLRARGRKGS